MDTVPDQYVNEVELVWREHLPLGLNLLMNDASGFLKLVDLPKESQARKIAIERDLDPEIFKGATVMSINGTRYDANSQEELIDALRNPSRPKSVSFELANPEDAQRIHAFVAGTTTGKDDKVMEKQNEEKVFALEEIEIAEEGPVGIRFSSPSDGLSLRIDEFLVDENGISIMKEKSDNLSVGDILYSINDKIVFGENGRDAALEKFQSCGAVRPLSIIY